MELKLIEGRKTTSYKLKLSCLGVLCSWGGGSNLKLNTHCLHQEQQRRSGELLCEPKGVGRRVLLAPFEIFCLHSHLAVES